MSALDDTRVFNRKDRIIEGWYWLCRSEELRSGKTRAIRFLDRELVLYRGESGQAYALDAYCPHMGAHLSQGSVQGEELRCFFHHWKFDCSGACVNIPAQGETQVTAFVPKLAAWPIEEKYGLVWLWTGPVARTPVPYVPELKGQETDALLGSRFEKNCHPNVVMINAIDAQHFNSVHPLVKELAGNLNLVPYEQNENNIEFRNETLVPRNGWMGKVLHRFYAGPLTYWMSYWFAATGSVTVGPDFLHFHIIFALRPTVDGKTEGQTILVTRRRSGILGGLLNAVILRATRVVGNYFAKGDTLIFSLINFNFRTPIKQDHAIIKFVQHAERQRLAAWSTNRERLPGKVAYSEEPRELSP